jgi:hypothetical protein
MDGWMKMSGRFSRSPILSEANPKSRNRNMNIVMLVVVPFPCCLSSSSSPAKTKEVASPWSVLSPLSSVPLSVSVSPPPFWRREHLSVRAEIKGEGKFSPRRATGRAEDPPSSALTNGTTCHPRTGSTSDPLC